MQSLQEKYVDIKNLHSQGVFFQYYSILIGIYEIKQGRCMISTQ